MVSFACIIGELWSWTIVAFAFITMIFREIQEEKELLNAFGEKYLLYKSKTFALIDLFPMI
jgi:protein-S-isoprenylcysteine O-methyltransferase Ste14